MRRSSQLSIFDRTPPPLFHQGASALSKLALFCALALFLMALDARLRITQPLRAVLATVVFPVQWLVVQPLKGAQLLAQHLERLSSTAQAVEHVREQLAVQRQKAQRAEHLELENQRLRALLELRQTVHFQGVVGQVLFDSPDHYSRKVVVDKGVVHNVQIGSPVLDEYGVLGQVTRVHGVTSEVTLLTDREQTIPLLNTRTGERSVGYGDPSTYAGTIELRFVGTTADVQVGDLLTTSGVDGVYASGLPVAKIEKIERRADNPFAKIHSRPVARMQGATHVMLIAPVHPLGAAVPLPQTPEQHSAQERGGQGK